MHAQSAVEPKLPQSIEKLIETLQGASPVDPAQARTMLLELDIDTTELGPWEDFRHPVRDSYGRVLLANGANFELLLMSWAPGDYSAIHDHGEAEWGAVRYFGPADHALFSEQDGVLSISERLTMRPDDVFAVNHSLIHLMGNPSSHPFTSLHLYGRAQASTTITGGARIFDLLEERIQRTDGGVFFCLPECEIKGREACPSADTWTRRFHHGLMLSRIERILAAAERPDGLLSEKARRLRAELR